MNSESRVFALAALALVACADFSRGDPTPVPDAAANSHDGSISTTGDTAPRTTFASTIHALLLDQCAGCHATGKQAATSTFLLNGDLDADARSTRALIDLQAPAGSRLLSKASGTGHAGGVVIAPGSGAYTNLLTWIQSGAP